MNSRKSKNLSYQKIIPEIGYNHLGSLFLYRYLINLLAENFNQYTIQYRLDNFPEKDILTLQIESIINENLKLRKKFPNVKIGLATESLDVILNHGSQFDFFKIISDGTNDKRLSSFLSNQEKLHCYSVGNNSPAEIRKLLDNYYKNGKSPNLNFTSFDESGNDISLSEVKQFEKISNELYLGLHQNTDYQMYGLFSILEIQNIFIYVATSDKNIATPDFKHSRTINQLIKIRDNLEYIQRIKTTKPRTEFLEYDHSIKSTNLGIE